MLMYRAGEKRGEWDEMERELTSIEDLEENEMERENTVQLQESIFFF